MEGVDIELAIIENSICRLHRLNGSEEWREVIGLAELVLKGDYDCVLRTGAARQLLGTDMTDLNADVDLTCTLQGNVQRWLNETNEEQEIRLRSYSLLFIGVSVLQLFVQNNWVGPPTQSDPFDLLPSIFSPEEQRKPVEEYITNSLSVDGEPVYGLSSHLLYLYLARTLLMAARTHLTHTQTGCWWLMRCLQIHQAMLTERSPTLKNLVTELLEEVCKKEPLVTHERNNECHIQLCLEAGHLMYFYYEPSEAKQHFATAKKLAGLEIELTGAMGKRTRYQEQDVAQLVLNVTRSESVSSSGDGDTARDVAPSVADSSLPKDVALDDDTVLNQISLTEPGNLRVTAVSASEQAVMLAHCHEHRRSHEGISDIIIEESLAYISCVLSQRRNWNVISTALFLRTQWEKGSSRRLERGLAQLEELSNQFEHKTDNVNGRLHLVYCVRMLSHWQFQRELSQFLWELGAASAALEIYLRLQIWEDAIKCYKQLGRVEKAEMVIREQLAIKETPSLWCHLGDVLEDVSYYHKSWELSNQRFSRAQRAMGYHYLVRGKFSECLGCFEKTLHLNPLQIGVWFSYGCASMACEKFEDGAKAFRRCVNINTDNFEAWNNLSNCYIRLNQKPRAFVILKEAIKCDYENWRIWENCLLVGVDCGEFEDVIRSYHRLLDLKQKHLDAEILAILVRSVTERIPDARGVSAARLREPLLQLFGRITAKVTPEAAVWRLYGELLLSDAGDIPVEKRQRALQYLQKSHRCLTQAGNWEKDVAKCKEVAEHSIKLANMYLGVAAKVEDSAQVTQMLSSARLMLKGVSTTIRQKHTEPINKALEGDLVEPCTQLDQALQRIIDTLAAERGT